MNEITKIHLGRQAFTIAIDAHKALQDYLRAIKRHMGDSDEAVEEVELRMAELLVERGVTGDKVVLLKDVEHLKEQLGKPGDFGDGETESSRDDAAAPKRLFRDTDNAMVAGVAVGIGKYVGIDPLWIRLLFVVLVLAGASGVLIYIILWLVIPEAKTSSERLQMQGKPVTVDALKEVAERADMRGAAIRAQRVVRKTASVVVSAFRWTFGLAFLIAGICAGLALIAFGIYWAMNPDILPANIFPVGIGETVLAWLVLAVVFLVATFFVITGLAMVKAKWPLPGWVSGVLLSLFLIGSAVGVALALDAAPKIRDRNQAAYHTQTIAVAEFDKLHVLGNAGTIVRYEDAATYAISIKYWGDADLSGIKPNAANGTLTLDVRGYADNLKCKKLCLFRDKMIAEVIVRGPTLHEVVADMQGHQLEVRGVHDQVITIKDDSGFVFFPDLIGDKVSLERKTDNVWVLGLTGEYRKENSGQSVAIYEDRTAAIRAKDISVAFTGECGNGEGQFNPDGQIGVFSFQNLVVNGNQVGSYRDLLALFSKPGPSTYKCLAMPPNYSEFEVFENRVQTL